jgi:hypothetical protein
LTIKLAETSASFFVCELIQPSDGFHLANHLQSTQG